MRYKKHMRNKKRMRDQKLMRYKKEHATEIHASKKKSLLYKKTRI